MKMTQFAKFTNVATQEIMGEVGLRQENLENMFSSSIKDGFLPDDYIRANYLEINGRNTRIDTGVSGNDNTLVFDFDFTTVVRSAYAATFGNYVNENVKCWRLINPSGTSDVRNYLFGALSARAGTSTSVNVVPLNESMTGKRINFRISYGKCVSHYGHYSNTALSSSDTTEQISNGNICIGAAYVTQSGESTFKGRFWKFKIYSHDKLIRNYIPAIRKTDQKAGFFDTVNQTFNPSIGESDFIAG